MLTFYNDTHQKRGPMYIHEDKFVLQTEEYELLINLAQAAEVALEFARSKQNQRAEPWQGTLITILDKHVTKYKKYSEEYDK